MLVKEAFDRKKALAKIQKTEINTYIDEFVKARQKYFTDGQEWLEAKVTDEKIYVQIDRKQLEEELDDMIKISLQFGRVLPLEMKIQVRKVAGGAEISYMDNGAGSWRCGRIYASEKAGRAASPEKRWGVQIA